MCFNVSCSSDFKCHFIYPINPLQLCTVFSLLKTTWIFMLLHMQSGIILKTSTPVKVQMRSGFQQKTKVLMIFRVIKVLLEMWEWFRFLFCMCFVEAFTYLSESLLQFGVFPLPLPSKRKWKYLTVAGEWKLKSLYCSVFSGDWYLRLPESICTASLNSPWWKRPL